MDDLYDEYVLRSHTPVNAFVLGTDFFVLFAGLVTTLERVDCQRDQRPKMSLRQAMYMKTWKRRKRSLMLLARS
jgi:hypothetical protein